MAAACRGGRPGGTNDGRRSSDLLPRVGVFLAPSGSGSFKARGTRSAYLAYAGLFLAEDMGSCARAERARNGVSVRILLGDPDGTCVAERGSDEGVGESVAARIRNALVHYQALRDVEGAEIRLHDTVLYNSIYRADDDLLINARLRHRRIPCPRPAPAQSRRRRHGEHIPGEL